jgi:hypothetical protein
MNTWNVSHSAINANTVYIILPVVVGEINKVDLVASGCTELLAAHCVLLQPCGHVSADDVRCTWARAAGPSVVHSGRGRVGQTFTGKLAAVCGAAGVLAVLVMKSRDSRLGGANVSKRHDASADGNVGNAVVWCACKLPVGVAVAREVSAAAAMVPARCNRYA